MTAKEVRVHKKMAVRIIKVGLPTGIQNMVISLSNVLVQVSVNGYGAAAMAGFAAYMKVDGFNILPVLSFSMAATTFVGQNFGAGKIDRVKKGTFVTLGMCVIYTILTGILLLVFQDSIMHLFTGDETVIAYGKICMLYFCPFYWMLGILQGLAGTVRGTGKSVPPMVVLLISLCLFRIVWIQFALPLFAGIEGVLLVYPVSWAVGLCISGALTALSGGLLAQYQKSSDINVGTGMVTIALASLIIGETLVGRRTMVRRVLGVVFGSCLYRFIVAVALRFNVPAAAMKLVSALIVAVAISMPAIRAKFAFEQRKHNARKEVH